MTIFVFNFDGQYLPCFSFLQHHIFMFEICGYPSQQYYLQNLNLNPSLKSAIQLMLIKYRFKKLISTVDEHWIHQIEVKLYLTEICMFLFVYESNSSTSTKSIDFQIKTSTIPVSSKSCFTLNSFTGFIYYINSDSDNLTSDKTNLLLNDGVFFKQRFKLVHTQALPFDQPLV